MFLNYLVKVIGTVNIDYIPERPKVFLTMNALSKTDNNTRNSVLT